MSDRDLLIRAVQLAGAAAAELAEIRATVEMLHAELEPFRPMLARLRPAGGAPPDMLTAMQAFRDGRRAARHSRR